MSDRNETGIGLRLASGLLEIGCVIAGTIAGVVVWSILVSVIYFVASGAVNDTTAFNAGRAAAHHAFDVGGTIGAIAGAFLGYRFSVNQEAPAAWLTAGLLSLVFIARGMGIV